MPKMISIKNRNHPIYMRDACGRKAKMAARKLSNMELDEMLETNVPSMDDLTVIMSWTRGQKIRFIRQCAMDNFVRAWKEQNKEAI